MPKLLKEAIEHYFRYTDVIRIYATVYEYNTASMRVLEKAGFQKTGVHRRHVSKNGQFINAHYYELLKNNRNPLSCYRPPKTTYRIKSKADQKCLFRLFSSSDNDMTKRRMTPRTFRSALHWPVYFPINLRSIVPNPDISQ